jgi:hypothetical protein
MDSGLRRNDGEGTWISQEQISFPPQKLGDISAFEDSDPGHKKTVLQQDGFLDVTRSHARWGM